MSHMEIIPANLLHTVLYPKNKSTPVDSDQSHRQGDLMSVSEESPPVLKLVQPPGYEKPILENPLLGSDTMIQSYMIENAKSVEMQVQMADNDIRNDLTKKKDLHQERLLKVKETLDKLRKAKKSTFFGKIFGWIASVAMAIIGVVLISTGAGAVAGGLMLAAAALMLTQQISAETGDWLNKGVAKIFQACGMSEEKALQAAQITVMATIAVLAIGSGVGMMGLGAEMSASMQLIYSTAQIVAGTAVVGQGTTEIITGVTTKQAKDQEAASMEVAAMIKNLMFTVESNYEHLKLMVEAVNEKAETTSRILGDAQESKHTLMTFQNV